MIGRARLLQAAALAAALGACAPGPAGTVTQAACAGGDGPNRFVRIEAGQFVKGADAIYPEEAPAVRLHVAAFEIAAREVSNAEFEAFVAATGYVTDAEKSAARGGPEAGSAVFSPPRDGRPGVWRLVAGATWKTPEGPGSSIAQRGAFPVVHVSLADARAYAAWAGGRLPTEEEWEHAARRGLRDPADPLSGVAEGKTPIANVWQGLFPLADLGDDGFAGAAPVGCFPADRAGLHDMIGNVWEWTDTPYAEGAHTIKGGSFLCAENFCRRYRAAARQPEEDDFSSSHIGFRVLRDAPEASPPP